MTREKLNNLEDGRLVELCRENVAGAFEVLYERYRLPLFSFLHRLLQGRSEEVDDFFQQTWLKAVRNLEKYQERQRFFGWLCRIAHNLVMDFYRNKSNAVTEELNEELAGQEDAPDVAEMSSQLQKALHEAIQQLPDEQRCIVKMRYEGVAFKDIAARQHISLNTALGRMHYAVQRLRKLLADYI